MDRNLKDRLRAPVTRWVCDRHPDAVEIAPHSGQRFVFRSEARAIKLLPNLSQSDRERCRREVTFLLEHDLEGLPRALTGLTEVQIGNVDFSMYEEVWIDGQALGDVVLQSGPDTGLADSLVKEGGRILSQVHEANVVHRDVSPGNVLVGARISLVDFGLAKYLDMDPITGTVEQLKMTRLYASPEQITSGSIGLGPPTDVYSLAMIAIFTRNGRHPFIDETETLQPHEYLARMAHRDFVVGITSSRLEYEMLHPIAAMRPRSRDIL
jgi:hypothetical protein